MPDPLHHSLPYSLDSRSDRVFTPGLEPLVATGLVRSYAARAGRTPVLDGVDLVAAPGTRVGLIGENGSGKSTLLRVLAGVDAPDRGHVQAPRDLVHLPQEPELPVDATVGGLLAATLRPLRDAVAELERLADELAGAVESPGSPGPPGSDGSPGRDVAAAYDRVLAWATHHDAWDADRRTQVVATALGVADLDPDRAVDTLSGGQRTRLALAAALVRRPSCLLLDEPTNHLDDDGMELLERSLVELPGVVVAASHDRVFLDRTCTEIVDLDAGVLGTDGRGGRRFSGGLSAYLEHQTDSRRRWVEAFTAQQAEIDRLRRAVRTSSGSRSGTDAIAHDRGPRDNDKFIYRFKGANVERARARRLRDVERRLEVAEREALPKPPAPLRFSGRLTGVAGDGPAVTVQGLRVEGLPGRGPRLVLDDLRLPMGGKLLVTGPNGSGKSTLLEVLAGRLAVDAGEVHVSARRVGLLAQDPDVGPPQRSAVAAYAEAVTPELAERVPLRALGLLHPREHSTPVGSLSVGQRRRLALAIAVAAAPDLLLLDEPTNHVSLALAAELEEAVGVAAGTVVVASHDRWLRSRWTGDVHDLATT